jgi:hypothetical protein
MHPGLPDQVTRLLLTEPLGLSEPEIRRRLRPRISQPTLWRVLNRLRAEGRLVVEGRARSTRYQSCERTDAAALRSRHLHQLVAERLVRDASLLDLARERLKLLRQVNPHERMHHDRWATLMDGPLPALLRTMTEVSEHADALRKQSPFTVLVDANDRQRIFETVRAA